MPLQAPFWLKFFMALFTAGGLGLFSGFNNNQVGGGGTL